MKSAKSPRFVVSSLVLLSFLAVVSAGLAQKAPYIYIWSPTNGAMYLAPANLTLYARAVGNTNPVQTVEFFAGSTSLGIVTNLPGVLVTNVEPLYPLAWSNVLAGNYALKAVATDVQGLMATSAVVNISVVTNLPPPPVVRPAVYIYSPTNGAQYLAPATLTLYARAVETSGTVQTVEFFAGKHESGRGVEQQPGSSDEYQQRAALPAGLVQRAGGQLCAQGRGDRCQGHHCHFLRCESQCS